MSKLSQLKKDAFQAGKKRNWEEAVALYERILELDKNNPTVINELGDLCLKAGKTPQAVRYFLSAAAKYRQTGLLNNAVAIYKKILRYDSANLNAHWYLAETRSNQGLLVEGEIHALQFLDGSENVSGDIREIFLKRCVQLLELYGGSEEIMDRLVHVFHTWEMTLEANRAALLNAVNAWDTGREDEGRDLAATVLKACPQISNYPEHERWQSRVNPGASKPAVDDYGAIELAPEAGNAEPADAPSSTPAAAAPEPPAAEPVPAAEPAAATPASDADEQADDGSIAIDLDGDADFEELIAAATGAAKGEGADAASDDAVEIAVDDAAGGEAATAEPEGEVDLLAEILADDSSLLEGGDSSQVEAISRDIGAQVGGDAHDPESLYNTGTVYLEMGMHDQAAEAFAQVVAIGDAGFSSRAREMWGVALQKSERYDEAVDVLRQGVGELPGGAERVGLLYHLGQACEAAGRPDEAIAAYEEIRAAMPGYLDVDERLASLAAS